MDKKIIGSILTPMTNQKTSNSDIKTEESKAITFAEFLETVPPNQLIEISDLIVISHPANKILTPALQLHCPDSACGGNRTFRCTDGEKWVSGNLMNVFINYICSNCRRTEKIFSLLLECGTPKKSKGAKYGELPSFGPPVPSRLISLIGPDRELFLRGRTSENQGLGIGAFGYYRRVVENQKNRIFDEIIKVAEKLGSPQSMIDELSAAKTETQFTKAMDKIKSGLPQALLMNGQNPLLLLHGALSEGLHDRTDEECLEIAGSIRVVLSELADKLSQALKDEAEVKHALNTLQKFRNAKP